MTRRIDWDAQPLGEVPDAEIARRLGCSRSVVYYQRAKRGIAAFKMSTPTHIDWDTQPLGQVSDRRLARHLGVSRNAVYYQRQRRHIRAAWTTAIDWDEQPLGELPDTKLAARLGVQSRAVANQRRRRDISNPEKPRSRERWAAIRRELSELSCCRCGHAGFRSLSSSCTVLTQQLSHLLCPTCGNYVTTIVVAADVAGP